MIKKYFSVLCTLALVFSCVTAQPVFAATNNVEPETISVSFDDNETVYVDIDAAVARANQPIGSNGAVFNGGGQITIPITVTGHVARSLRVTGLGENGEVGSMTIWGAGCGELGKNVALDGVSHIVTNSVNSSTAVTYWVAITPSGTNFRVAFTLLN